MITLLVCGGRNYESDAARATVNRTLGALLRDNRELHVLHGGCGADAEHNPALWSECFKGADWLADEWAKTNIQRVTACPAAWTKYGKPAGMIRNREMLKHEPQLVVAFPGDKGTRGMIALAQDANVPVLRVGWPKEVT